ncbi:MAG: hypothetical protein M1835_000725, partial [Candelina submexicana]
SYELAAPEPDGSSDDDNDSDRDATAAATATVVAQHLGGLMDMTRALRRRTAFR